VSRAKGFLRALTNTDPTPKRLRTTATLSKGRHSVNPCRFAALRRRDSPCLQGIARRSISAMSVRGEPVIQMRKSVITRSPHAARATVGLSVSSLSRDQVELLLRLVEAETDALLVE
jgi:hypothetical protein